jgi:NAD(P)-dependent dehydrogenase (short-subunit alcohol dehydrogenase family)
MTDFCPSKAYDMVALLSRRKSQVNIDIYSEFVANVIHVEYDMLIGLAEAERLHAELDLYDHIDIVYAAYSPVGLRIESEIKEITTGLRANCIGPISFFAEMSRIHSKKTLNGVFISSIYAHLAPRPANYKEDSEINPLYYGVSKAAVEQGLRWLSAQSPLHSFNSIALGPIPRKEVVESSPLMVRRLTESMPSGRFVRHEDLHSLINMLLAQNGSLRGHSIFLDGGYAVW